MNRYFRSLLYVISAFQIALALGFILQVPAINEIWPLPYTNEMSYIFIGSILAAAGASTLWCLVTRAYHGLTGVALDYLAIMIPLAVLVFQLFARTRRDGLILLGLIAGASAVFGLVLLLIARRIPVQDAQPTPRLVLGSFVVFVIALILVGGAMVLKTPNILPWRTGTDAQIIYGWMFIGAAVYFAYGLVRRNWTNAGGQLMGFLAYDVVLIGPFLNMLPTVSPNLRLNLIVYILVVSYSGLLAIYYLFIHAPTRVWQALPARPAVQRD